MSDFSLARGCRTLDDMKHYVQAERKRVNQLESLLDYVQELEWEVDSLRARIQILMEARSGSSSMD